MSILTDVNGELGVETVIQTHDAARTDFVIAVVVDFHIIKVGGSTAQSQGAGVI